jgi:hypothetical protein
MKLVSHAIPSRISPYLQAFFVDTSMSRDFAPLRRWILTAVPYANSRSIPEQLKRSRMEPVRDKESRGRNTASGE